MTTLSSIKKWAPFLAMLAVYFLPAVAFAQGGPFDVPDSDLSRRTFIDPLFGPLVSDNIESPLTRIMGAFNSALLVVGGILMAYTIVAGTMSTAHDGEMLGKKWSSMWLPVRTALGVGAVLPVMGGTVKGWCVAQFIVVWLAMQGVGLANSLWSTFIGDRGSAISASASYNPPTNIPAVRDAYTAMLINSTCVFANQSRQQASGASSGLMGEAPYGIFVDENTPEDLVIRYGRERSFLTPGGLEADCGLLMMEEETSEMMGSDTLGRGDNSTSSRLLDMNNFSEPVIRARRVAFMNAHEELQVLARGIVDGSATQDQVNAKLKELLTEYATSVSQVARTSYAQNVDESFLKEMEADGWVMAGAFYMQLSKTQDLMTRAVTNAPSATKPPTKPEDSFVTGNDDPEVQALINRAKSMAGQASRAQGGGSVAAIGAESASADSEASAWTSQVVSWFINQDSAFSKYGEQETVDYNENPIIMAKGLGEKMTATAWGALGVATLAQVGLGGGVTGVGSFLAPVFAGLFFALIVPGATMSTYLPMLPYILWLGVVLGWAILLIEAVIAAPLWAIVHLAPDGDGVVGRGGQGYMLVLSLVLRPPLMVIGLVAAFVLMKPIGYLINSTFLGAFTMGVSPGFFGLTQAIAGCVVYAVLMITVVQRVFALIHVIPDRILRWIGGGGNEMGQEAGAVDQAVSNKTAVGLSAVQSIGSAAQQGLARGAAENRAGRLQAQQADNQNRDIADNAGNAVTDARQDIKMAEMSRDAETPMGRQNLANQHGKLARGAERAAIAEAKTDSSPEAKSFSSGLGKAQSQARNGDTKAVSKYMDQQMQKAQAAQASGAPLAPFQERLLDRAEALEGQKKYLAGSDSVRDVKRSSSDDGSTPPDNDPSPAGPGGGSGGGGSGGGSSGGGGAEASRPADSSFRSVMDAGPESAPTNDNKASGAGSSPSNTGDNGEGGVQASVAASSASQAQAAAAEARSASSVATSSAAQSNISNAGAESASQRASQSSASRGSEGSDKGAGPAGNGDWDVPRKS